MERSFAWDADMVDGKYDREYLFGDFANYFETFIENGYVPKTDDALQVMANGDMTVTLKKGKAFMDGYMYENTDDKILQIDPADGILSRIDRISVMWMKEQKAIIADVLKGVPSYNPVPTSVRRNADYKDYVVADILVEAGAIRVLQKDITDQRLNDDVCGMCVGFLNQINTKKLYIQIQKDLEFFRETSEREFSEWKKTFEEALQGWTGGKKDDFENWQREAKDEMKEYFEMFQSTTEAWINHIKDSLDENAAANLQRQIDEMKYYYVIEDTLYVPQTSTSVAEGILMLGTGGTNEY